MGKHTHKWRRVFEQCFIGPPFQTGWECTECREFHHIADMKPSGLPGITLEKASRLVGPHGGHGNCKDGSVYKEQLVDEDGKLTIIRP